MSKEGLNACLKCFYTSARKKDGTYYKTSFMKSIRAAIDHFLRSLLHNKPFSIIADPAFTEANKVLKAFAKSLRKTGKIGGVVYKKAPQESSKEQLKKPLDSRELRKCPQLLNFPMRLKYEHSSTAVGFARTLEQPLNFGISLISVKL